MTCGGEVAGGEMTINPHYVTSKSRCHSSNTVGVTEIGALCVSSPTVRSGTQKKKEKA